MYKHATEHMYGEPRMHNLPKWWGDSSRYADTHNARVICIYLAEGGMQRGTGQRNGPWERRKKLCI